MKIEFIANTGFYTVLNDVVFLHDPWLTNGAFEGAWHHFPPLCPTKYQIKDAKYIYVSHIHPDHYDPETLAKASKDCTFVVPNYFGKLLERNLRQMGFQNIVSLGHLESKELEPGLKVTLYKQFTENLFHEAEIGNLIDSALILEWNGQCILNANDNYPDIESAKKLKETYKSFDVAFIPHSASGPYPASFKNLNIDEKFIECQKLRSRYLNHFVEVADVLAAKVTIPCAAEYVVGGSQQFKNEYIGTIPAHEAEDYYREYGSGISKIVAMSCGTIFDTKVMQLSGNPYYRFSMAEKVAFGNKLAEKKYPHEVDPDIKLEELDYLFAEARKHLWQKQKMLNWTKDYNIYFDLGKDAKKHFNFNAEEICNWDGESLKTPYMTVQMDSSLMYRIMKKTAHWNNAEGGLLIDFYRKPNDYIPEIFTLMSFFHVQQQSRFT